MAEKSKKDGGQRYDWRKIKRDYVTDPQSSLKKISEKYHIRYRTVADKSRADDWFATKKKYQDELAEKVTANVQAKQVEKLSKEIEAAELLSDHILKALKDEEQFNRHIVIASSPAPEGIGVVTTQYEEIFDKMDTRALKDTAAALKAVEEIKRGLYGIMKAEQLNKDRRDNEKLEIEKQRLELDKQKVESLHVDDTVRVIIGGYEEGWDE